MRPFFLSHVRGLRALRAPFCGPRLGACHAFLVVAALSIAFAPCGSAAPAYAVTDLGSVDGFSMNNGGQVAGVAYDADGLQSAFLYSNGASNSLGTLGGLESGAFGINNSGQVVGWSDTTNGVDHAFLYSGGTMTDLGTLGGSNSYAYAIADNGQIVGWSENTSGVAHAFSYIGGIMTDLGPGYASALNTNGQVTGWTVLNPSTWHAFLYSGGVLNDLGTLGGTVSEGLAINNAGQVAGWSSITNDTQHAFLYSGVLMTDIGALVGTNSRANALNNTGQVVGSFDTNDLGGLHAFRYSGGVAEDLNNLVDTNAGWVLNEGIAINDQGWILVSAIRAGDLFHTLLLTPQSQSTGPILNINVADNSLVISWPASVTGYRLVQSPNPAGPTWTTVTNTPVITNGLNEVIFTPIPSGIQFYRLQSP